MDDSDWKYVEQMDTDGLQHLMSAYGQDIWNLAFLLTKRHHLADDITQDVFIKVYQSIHLFRGASSMKTWLLSITRNIAINYLRTAFMRKVTLTSWISTQGVNASAEKEVLEQSVAEEIWRVVLELPLKLREALILHAKYELSMKEIASVLGVSSTSSGPVGPGGLWLQPQPL
ncbi:RNA polymerase sigma factor [Paenibacillus sp. GCM10012307]|uniref:RNA polymerase sigma factor n=1 Tax=Paenibacillus roseus TaxID=2798579 RepID=A0A934J905_9BACL|nr:sigma-70 family RNA polymerase sigma factor [Paenibacillus roseus]MBJ6362647.1 sigma-70 family RNA polymerase sigma factor [Paenibacillus roseus]